MESITLQSDEIFFGIHFEINEHPSEGENILPKIY